MICVNCQNEIQITDKPCQVCNSEAHLADLSQQPTSVSSNSDNAQPRSQNKKLLAAAIVFAAVVAISIPLSYSKLHPTAATTPTPSASEAVFTGVGHKLDTNPPAVGSCWRSESFQVVDMADFYHSGKQVSCSSPHDSVTFSLSTLPQDTHIYYEDDYSLTGYPSNSGTQDAVRKICKDAFDGQFGPQPSRLNWLYFIPDPYAWAAGARWVRCDVYAKPYGQKIGDTAAEVNKYSLEKYQTLFAQGGFQLCMKLGSSFGPEDSDAVPVDCSGNWDLRLRDVLDISHYGNDYPGLDAIQQDAQSFCYAQGETYYYPTESGWAGGNRAIECWQNPSAIS